MNLKKEKVLEVSGMRGTTNRGVVKKDLNAVTVDDLIDMRVSPEMADRIMRYRPRLDHFLEEPVKRHMG